MLSLNCCPRVRIRVLDTSIALHSRRGLFWLITQPKLPSRLKNYLLGHLGQGSIRQQSTSGEPASLVPKEQPPRKLSGQRTNVGTKTLERGTCFVSAEGIAISGKRTEGASHVKAIAFAAMWCRMISRISGRPS